MGLRLKIIMNPSSGRETAKVNVNDMIEYLVSLGELSRSDIFYTAGRFDAMNFAMNTNEDDYDYIIAVGGDGTVNEVVTGMMKGNIKLPLAVYTSGTVNDFATINELPSVPSEFARMLLKPQLVDVDCGKVNESYFLNVLAGGLLTDVAYTVPSDLKTAFGPAAYWITAMKDLKDINKTIRLGLKTSEAEYEADTILFMISNSRSVGGFRKLMSLADLSDGKLDVLVVKKMEFTEVMPLLGKLIFGDHIQDERVIYFQTDRVELTNLGDEEIVSDLDGEEGPKLPITVECVHHAIKLVVPNKEELL